MLYFDASFWKCQLFSGALKLSCPTDDVFYHRICHQPGWDSFLVSNLTVTQSITEQPGLGSLCPLCPSLSGPEVCTPWEVRRPTWSSEFVLFIAIT